MKRRSLRSRGGPQSKRIYPSHSNIQGNETLLDSSLLRAFTGRDVRLRNGTQGQVAVIAWHKHAV